MTAQIIQYYLPAGIAGNVTRAHMSLIEANNLDPNYPVPGYGMAVKLVGGLIRPLATGDLATVIYGMIVRPYPINSTVGAPAALGAGVPPTSGMCDILREGYMTVNLARGTGSRGAAVGVRTTAGSHTLGDIEDLTNVAQGDSDCVLLGANFMGPADTNNLVEIYFKAR